MKTALSLALLIASSSVNEGAVSVGSVTSGSSTGGAVASRPSPGGGGGGADTLELATLRYNADDLSLADGDPVTSWPSTGTYTDATATLVQATGTAQPAYDDQDATMGNTVYFVPAGTTRWMKTGGLAAPIAYPAIVCAVYKFDSSDPAQPGNTQHVWEAFAQPGATANQHAIILGARAFALGNPISGPQRSHHRTWVSHCTELRDGAPSRLARNGELVGVGTFATGQDQMIDLSVGGLHNTFFFNTYRLKGKIADVAVWADIDTLGVSLADTSRDFTAAHGLVRASPHPDEPYPYSSWSASTTCDLTGEYGPGCNAIANKPQADGCPYRTVWPDGSGAEPPNLAYGSVGSNSLTTTGGWPPGGTAVCETTPADLLNGQPYVKLTPPLSTSVNGLKANQGAVNTISQPWSICMTFRIHAYPAIGNKRYLFGMDNSGPTDDVAWYLENNGGTTDLMLFSLDTSSVQTETTIALPALNTWSALCVEYDGASSGWALRQSGQSAQTGTWNPHASLDYITAHNQAFLGDKAGQKTPTSDWAKSLMFDSAIDTEAMVESLATQYDL